MKTFLGIPITWSVKNDADYVALVRRQLRTQTWLRWFALLIGILCFSAGIGFPMSVINLISSGDLSPFQDAGFAGGFAAGFVFFALCGFIVLLGAIEIGLAISFFKGYLTAARTSFRWFRQDIVPQMNKVFANTSFQIIERFGCSNLLSEFKKLCKEVFSWERGIYAKRQWIVSYTEKALRVFADCCIARLVGFANGLIVTALEMKAGLRAKPGSRCTPPRERAVMLSSEL